MSSLLRFRLLLVLEGGIPILDYYCVWFLFSVCVCRKCITFQTHTVSNSKLLTSTCAVCWHNLKPILQNSFAHGTLEWGILVECLNLLLDFDFRSPMSEEIWHSLQLPQKTILHLYVLPYKHPIGVFLTSH